MKKLLALILAASMCLCFTACGEEEAPAKQEEAPVTVPDGIWETTVANIDDAGNIELAVSMEELASANIVERNSLDITVADYEKFAGVLFLEEYEDAPGLLFVWFNEEEGVVEYVFSGNGFGELYPELKVGDKVVIERSPTMN